MASKYPQDAGQAQANPQGQQRGEECQTCDTYQRDVTLPRLSTPLQLKKGPDKDKIISTFLNAMNALLNKGEGCVFFHIDDPNLVGLFDEAVDDKLKLLIPNDFLFHQVFERTHIDTNHVVFRVRSTERPFISTLSFNSKVSLDKGLDDPTHAQMRKWIEEGSLSLQPSVQNTIASKLTFKNGKEVMVRNFGGSEVPFQESVKMQAKQLFETKPGTIPETDWFMNVKKFLWDKSYPYITAFSKLETGGSVFFGLREEKVEGVKVTFVCDGIKLSKDKRDDVEKTILNKIETEMAWLIHDCPKGWNPKHAVSVVFHAVTGNEPDLYVVEIAVKSVRGVSFYDKQPVAYKLMSGSPQPVTFEEWAKHQGLPLPVPGTERVKLIRAQNPPLYQTEAPM